jgi:hypothetical protein
MVVRMNYPFGFKILPRFSAFVNRDFELDRNSGLATMQMPVLSPVQMPV